MAGIERHPGNPPRPPGTVHVIHGVYEHRLPLGGKSVLAAKTFLRKHMSIPYFAEMVVNDKPVPANHVLQAGDLLTFIRPPGFKGAGEPNEPLEKTEAEGLLGAYPELSRIANAVKHEARAAGWNAAQAVDVMAVKAARWCEDHFGPVTREVVPTLNEVVKQLTKLVERADRLNHGKAPKKLGRKNTTQDIADFAAARRPQMSWKDIAHKWNQKHQDRHVNDQKVRDAWRRRYGDKAIASRKHRGES
jgi:hypothetical protein